MSAARALEALSPPLSRESGAGVDMRALLAASRRGYFLPGEDDDLRARYALYLNARSALLDTIAELEPHALPRGGEPDPERQVRIFAVAFAAACLLLRAGRFIVRRFSRLPAVREKLDEAEPRYRIPARQLTAIHRSVTSPRNAQRFAEACRFADARRDALEALHDDADLAHAARTIAECESAARAGLGRRARERWTYRWSAVRRRPRSAYGRAMFGIFELSGRAIAEMRNPWRRKRITPKVLSRVAALLRPGDILVTRHDDALSNLFLPGFWPHAALYLGEGETTRDELALALDAERASRWSGAIRTLEARKDGVRLRTIEDTLSVDSVAIIRPRLEAADVAQALVRALSHEGKLYDFEFDFRRSDRMVCTEVVYRAYAGVGGIEITPRMRIGRPTISAEDILDLAVDGRGFDVVAVYGAKGCRRRPVTGAAARETLAWTYRPAAAPPPP